MTPFKSLKFGSLAVCLVTLFACLIAILILITRILDFQNAKQFEQLEKKYPLISKRILREIPQDILINFLPLRNKIRTTAAEYGDSFAVYFEYLPTGVSIGVNEKDEFQAASLFKIPYAMAYYRTLEDSGHYSNPTLDLSEKNTDPEFGDLWEKGNGFKISAEEAIKLAITESDNTAIKLILPHIRKESLEEVYNGLDIDSKIFEGSPVLTAKSYSSILKVLYFSSVLNKDDSERILNLMTQTKFNDKLPSGIPAGVPVAHKIGDFKGKLFMDCGIVYPSRRSYLLCMVSHSDEETARERMGNMSKLVYDNVVAP